AAPASTAARARCVRPACTPGSPPLRAGQDPDALQDGRLFGFGADTGTGCFLDAAGRDHFTERARRPRHLRGGFLSLQDTEPITAA
ncbi:DUF4241 domain-containing protein, partial [Streptomonospora algeriensis]